MKRYADLLYEMHMLKHIPRTGYPFLGVGSESVAEHTFMTIAVGTLLAEIVPDVNREKLITMCLIHDLPEARTGDLNAVNKRYAEINETGALEDATRGLPLATGWRDLMDEFNAGQSVEARLARDADQLAFMVDLNALKGRGHPTPEKWLVHVNERLKTDAAKSLAKALASREWDGWWLDDFVDTRP